MKNTIKLMNIIILLTLISCNTSKNEQKKKINVSIQDSWILKNLNGENLSGEKAKTAPELTFNLNKNEFYGSDGCNRIFGKIEIHSNNKLIFNDIAGTLMDCEDMTIPQQYNSLLGKVYQYELSDSTLLLKDKENNTLLTFYKLIK